MLAGCVLLILASAINDLSQFNSLLLLIFALVMGVDFWRSRAAPLIETQLHCQQHFALGRAQQAQVIIKNNAAKQLKLDVSVHYSQQLACELPVQSVELAAQQQVELNFPLQAHWRGEAQLLGVECRVSSPWYFWQHSWFSPQQVKIKVYPDFS